VWWHGSEKKKMKSMENGSSEFPEWIVFAVQPDLIAPREHGQIISKTGV
jgi:hypothetical protein